MPHHAALYFDGASSERDVRVDCVTASNDDVVLEESIEVASDGHLWKPRAAYQSIDRRLPVVLQG